MEQEVDTRHCLPHVGAEWSCDQYYKIVRWVEIGVCDCLRNNDIYLSWAYTCM